MNSEMKTQAIDSKPRDRVIGRQEAAHVLNVSTKTLRRMEIRSELPPRVQLTERCYGFRESDIERMIAARAGQVAA